MEAHQPKRPRRRVVMWTAIGVITVLVAVAGVMLVAKNAGGNGKEGKDKEKEGPLASPVELTEVRRGNIDTFLETTTTLEARNSATLVSRAAGQVIDVLAEEGQWVNKGDVLAKLDDTEKRLAVERTQLGYEVAQRELERGQQLQSKDYLSEKELDDLELELRNADVALQQARYELSQTRLVAPFSGRVTRRSINLGEHVTVGQPCYEMVDFDPLRARLYFPERDLSRVRVGQEAELTMDTHPGEVFKAVVSVVNPVVDKSNGTFRVTLELPNKGGMLRPGTFTRVRLRTGSFENTLLLPRRGVMTEDGEAFVYVANGDSVNKVPITLGAIEHDTAQVLTGLDEGDSVVTVGQGGLKPGAKIKAVTL